MVHSKGYFDVGTKVQGEVSLSDSRDNALNSRESGGVRSHGGSRPQKKDMNKMESQ